MQKHLLTIKQNLQIADKIYELVLEGNFDQKEFHPGKFLHIKCSNSLDPLLRRPMSICDVSDDEKELTVLYRADGKGTQILSEQEINMSLDVLAPLGQGFDYQHIKAGQKVLLIGGGIGVPPLYYLGRKLKEQGAEIISILGFNSAKDVFYENKFSELGDVYITTMDGTYGQKGMVTDAMRDLDFDSLYCCGPNIMMAAIQKLVPLEKDAYMSLEERMGCGVGACLACVCKYNPEQGPKEKAYARVCSEGPVFGLHEILL